MKTFIETHKHKLMKVEKQYSLGHLYQSSSSSVFHPRQSRQYYEDQYKHEAKKLPDNAGPFCKISVQQNVTRQLSLLYPCSNLSRVIYNIQI